MMKEQLEDNKRVIERVIDMSLHWNRNTDSEPSSLRSYSFMQRT